MCRDPIKSNIWAYTARSVYKLRMTREARDVWGVFLGRNEFELARRYCMESGGDVNVVVLREAQHLYDNKKYIESARLYGDSQMTLSEVGGFRGGGVGGARICNTSIPIKNTVSEAEVVRGRGGGGNR